MAKNLLIVESPSKAKTLKKYLGGDFEILASYGHVRDLVPKSGAVDPDNGFAMKYQLISRNSKHVDAIVAGAKEAENIYLATDPDREGEAISLASFGNPQIQTRPEKHQAAACRVPRNHQKTPCSMPLPIRAKSKWIWSMRNKPAALWTILSVSTSRHCCGKKIRRGLSAGRVQSPALRLICERENEIRAFEAQEYWTVHLDSHKGRSKFTAKLAQYNGAKLEQFDLPNEAAQADVLKELEGKEAVVSAIEKKKRSRNPAAPFTTSTMQQDAVRKLGFTTDRTMRTAQQLYEGIDVGQGATGLITYMRTDSVNLADEALTEIRHYIENKSAKNICQVRPSSTKPNPKTPKKPTKPSVRLPCTARLKVSNPS